MAVHPGEEIAVDENRNIGSSGITDDSTKSLEKQEIRNLRVDPDTSRLLAQIAELTGVLGDTLKTQDTNSDTLKEILVELKAIKKHLYLITETDIDGTE